MDFKNLISVKTIIILALILAIILSLSEVMDQKRIEEPKEPIEKQTITDSTIIMERIEKLWELSSSKYFYSNVVAYKDNMKIKDFHVPFTEKSFLIKYDGYIKAGINAADIDISVNEGKVIKIKLKNSRILDHVIDEKSIYVYDEKDSVFNNLSIEDIFNQLTEEKDNIEAKLEKKGFLKEVDKNIQTFLEELLKNLGYETIEIEFESGTKI